MLYFNPRTPGRVRHVEKIIVDNERVISIHAPRVGCDYPYLRRFGERISISIHAPRVGCDATYATQNPLSLNYFNPRTPGRVRRKRDTRIPLHSDNFNPRTPGRVRRQILYYEFIHIDYFNPRTPGRVRPYINTVTYRDG